MSRKRTEFNISTGVQIDIPYTAEEELAQDEQEIVLEEERKILQAQEDRKTELGNKLADDSINFSELKELMRLRG